MVYYKRYRNLFKERLKPKKKELVEAETLFNSLLFKLGFNPKQYAVFEIWDRLMGPLSKKAQAVGLNKGRLYVQVDSNARMHDISLRKRNLIRKLNEHFGTERVISDIIVKLISSD